MLGLEVRTVQEIVLASLHIGESDREARLGSLDTVNVTDDVLLGYGFSFFCGK